MEILAMTTSIVCMIILIWILAHFQDQQSATWSFWISLNGVVAISATVIKATLLAVVSACLSQEKWWHFGNRSRRLQDLDAIDHASRGPVGSLMLLLGSSWGFASFGAIITILCLTTDTFFQQVVSFESEITYTLQEGSATFGYALSFGIDRSAKELAGSIDAEEGDDDIKRSSILPMVLYLYKYIWHHESDLLLNFLQAQSFHSPLLCKVPSIVAYIKQAGRLYLTALLIAPGSRTTSRSASAVPVLTLRRKAWRKCSVTTREPRRLKHSAR
jgi:hypothetical protein